MGHQMGIFYLLIWGFSQACPRRAVQVEPGWESNSEVENVKVIEADPSGGAEPWQEDQGSSLPEDIQELTKLLAAVAGEN